MNSDERVVERALESLHVIYGAIAKSIDQGPENEDAMDVDTDADPIKTYRLDLILNEAKIQLTSEDLDQCCIVGKLLGAITQSSGNRNRISFSILLARDFIIYI